MSGTFLDITKVNWKAPVATTALLPTVGNQDGDGIVSLDNHLVNVWNATGSAWVTMNVGTLTSVGLSLPNIFTVSGSPVTTTGTLTATLATETANTHFAGPTSGGAATPTFRALVGADLPNPSASTLGGIQSAASQASKWINSISTSGVPSLTQPAFTDISGTLSGTSVSGGTFGAVNGSALTNLNGSSVASGTVPAANVAQINLAASGNGGVTGTAPYGNGGTGATSLTNHGVVVAGASALSTVAPGTSGNVLTSNGTDWASSTPASGVTINSTPITSGTTTRVLYDNAGTVGEYSVTGSANVVMSASPTLTGTVVMPTSGAQTTANTTWGASSAGISDSDHNVEGPLLKGLTLYSGVANTKLYVGADGSNVIIQAGTVGAAPTLIFRGSANTYANYTYAMGFLYSKGNFLFGNDFGDHDGSTWTIGGDNTPGKTAPFKQIFVDRIGLNYANSITQPTIAAGTIQSSGNMILNSVGGSVTSSTNLKTLQYFSKESGSNDASGSGTLSGGTATITTTKATGTYRVFVTDTTTGALTNVGSLNVTAKNSGNFVVTSTNVLDTSTFDWFIVGTY